MDFLATRFPTGLSPSVQNIIKDLARENVQLHRALTYLRAELEQIAIDRRPRDRCHHADHALEALESVLGDVP